VLVRLGQLQATTFAELVRKARDLPFETILRKDDPVSLRVTCHKSRLYHSGAVAERVHEAIEARLGGKVQLSKPDEEGDSPPQLVLARLDHDVCTVSADSSGALLHRRGYSLSRGRAPLRETLAAALLLAARYDAAEALLDPLCGSGTIAIEAALIALRRAPGLSRVFAFERWPGHYDKPFAEMKGRAAAGQLLRAPAPILASDADAAAVSSAMGNAARAGVEGVVQIEQRALREVQPPPGLGLLATNPPYGVRIAGDLRRLYAELGDLARRSGWRAAALVADGRAAQRAGLTWKRALRTRNGGLPVELLVT
jgi:putative N6-adenine-specific DNA methylase